MADEFQITRICQLDHMVFAPQECEKGRRLIEQLHEALALGRKPPLCQHLFGCLGADDENAAHAVESFRLIDGTVAISPIHILQLAVANDGHELIFMPRRALPPHHLFDLRSYDPPNLSP